MRTLIFPIGQIKNWTKKTQHAVTIELELVKRLDFRLGKKQEGS